VPGLGYHYTDPIDGLRVINNTAIRAPYGFINNSPNPRQKHCDRAQLFRDPESRRNIVQGTDSNYAVGAQRSGNRDAQGQVVPGLEDNLAVIA
jgi:hypothetical protein